MEVFLVSCVRFLGSEDRQDIGECGFGEIPAQPSTPPEYLEHHKRTIAYHFPKNFLGMYVYSQLLNNSTLRIVVSVKYQRNHRHQNTMNHKIPLTITTKRPILRFSIGIDYMIGTNLTNFLLQLKGSSTKNFSIA